MGFSKRIVGLVIVSLTFGFTAASGLATVVPCPDCASSIAPRPVTITAQYQWVPACQPSTTTLYSTYTKRYATESIAKVKTVPSCSTYAWVSTTIPAIHNRTKTTTVVMTTNQPVTFSSLHYTKAYTTTITLPQNHFNGYGSHRNGTHQEHTSPKITTKVSYTTIDIKKYCGYNSIGPLAISGYEGSGLSTDCGPDANSALTQRLTVVSCSDKHCTTFNETWIAYPKTSSASGKPYTVTTTDTYCPTATPETAMPGYTNPMPTGTGDGLKPSAPPLYATPSSSRKPSATYPEGYRGPTSNSLSAKPTSYEQQPGKGSSPGSYPNHPEPTEAYPELEPTGYEDGGPDPSGDPSADLDHEQPEPTAYHRGSDAYKLFKRQGLERPNGRVMKRSGLLFWGS